MSQHKEKTGQIEKPETAAPREGFMGKAPFAGALLGPDDPILRMRTERQVSASAFILDVVNEAVEAKQAYLGYGRLLIREATRIANTEEQAPQGAITSVEAKPANKKEALIIALSRLAPGSSITDEKPSRMDGSVTLFTVSWKGEGYRIPVRDSVMELAEPVAEIEMMARAVAIGWTDEDARERSLESRKASRPDCSPLNIMQKSLDDRLVTFDGVMTLGEEKPVEDAISWNTFTYLVDGMETTFTIPSHVTGEDLLRGIESKIIGIHLEERKGGKAIPIPASIIEGNARCLFHHKALIDADENVRIAAMALDHLALTLDLPVDIVPDRYRESVIRLNALPRPKPVTLSEEGREEMRKALQELDHPGYAVARAMHAKIIEENGSLGEEGRNAILAALKEHERKPNEICEKALHNLARAYGKINGDMTLLDAKHDELQSAHLQMILYIKRGLSVMDQDGIIKIERAEAGILMPGHALPTD